MLLKHLKESSSNSDSAIQQLGRLTASLAVLFIGPLTDQIQKLYAEGQHEDMYKTTKFMTGRIKATWFIDNYLSTSRHTSSREGIKNALITIAQDPKYSSIKAELLDLSSMQINMDKEEKARLEISYSSYTTELAQKLPGICYKLSQLNPIYKDTLQQSALRLINNSKNFNKLWDDLQEKYDNEWGKNSNKPEVKKPNEQKQLSGSQNNQADQLVNQVLSSIPDKKAAHEIRQLVARSDNKLAVLQVELTKRGIKL